MEWKPNNNHTQWYVITKSLLFAAQKPLFPANKRHALQKIELTWKTLSKDENVILKCAFTLNTFCHWMAGVDGIWSTFGLCSMMVPGRINFKVTVIQLSQSIIIQVLNSPILFISTFIHHPHITRDALFLSSFCLVEWTGSFSINLLYFLFTANSPILSQLNNNNNSVVVPGT